MKPKYEISVWEDVLSESGTSFEEKKIIVIGSNTMTSESRAREPKLVANIDGTNKFTFNMYYSYIDTSTGERVKNPYVQYLINERKIKVLWKDKWYDLLIKQIKEDSVQHLFTYTCEDAYITELSRTGFELTFATELENNIGTAQELVERVIENTDWQFDEENSDIIYQETEEPVYEAMLLNNAPVYRDPDGRRMQIAGGFPVLVYYSCAPDKENLKSTIQFYYNGKNTWDQDANDMLVINGTSYTVNNVTWTSFEDTVTAWSGPTQLFTLNLATGLSTRYRAKRYVQSQKTVYNSIVDRYVNVYNNGDLLGYKTTEFNDALSAINLFTNPTNFKNTSGWKGEGLYFKISPGFDNTTVIAEYTATSYLYIPRGRVFNMGIQNNRPYIPNGFIEGEKYILRLKVKQDGTEPANSAYITNPAFVNPSVQSRNMDYEPTGVQYFTVTESKATDGYWLEYDMTCIKSCPYEMILSTSFPFGLFLEANANYWLEEAQFYREIWGEDSDGNPVRIDPNQMSYQSVAQTYWKYFDAEQPEGTTKDSLEYAHISLDEWSGATPVYNNFARYGTIEADNSNRFNILQTIAETFECWVRFEIEHDDKGYIIREDGVPRKLIRLKRETGQETGIGFIYGIDLKGIVRNVKSDKISTKTIVEQNENQFGENGFCTIARSEQNYPRENFIYNFDYYINHGLLDKNVLYDDLYNIAGMAYYSHLHSLNSEYAQNLDYLTNKKSELTKQTATATVYNQYILAAEDELASINESIMKLAGVTNIEAGLEYAKSHYRDTKVQSLVDDRSITQESIKVYKGLQADLQKSLATLEEYIANLEARRDEIISELTALNRQFYIKYSRFIQEGTWTSEDYWNDDLYYLDALQVAYTSSRPQVSYDISVLRISDIEDYSSKVFNLGDISFIQDTEYFGYKEDKITPYKERVVLTEITSYFDTPDKDVIKVQNYKNQFDDLFQRITAAVQNLELAQGKYAKAANIVTSDGTIRSSVIQNTFNENKDLVYGAQNESATIDNTGITVTDNADAARQVKITSGGVFVTNDGGNTWRNAIRGDGISTDLLTAGRINTEQITVYNGEYPSFRWDPNGLNAYKFTDDGRVDTTQFVRFDQYGIYGIQNAPEVYVPSSEGQIYQDASFGLTWNKFFMKSANNGKFIEISTDRDIVVNDGLYDRVVIGRVDGALSDNYGMKVVNADGDIIFQCDSENGSYLSGWTLTKEYLESEMSATDPGNIRIYANGNIGCYGHEAISQYESVYTVQVVNNFTATGLNTGNRTFSKNEVIYPFVSSVGKTKTQFQIGENYSATYDTPPAGYVPVPPSVVQIAFTSGNKTYNYNVDGLTWNVTLAGVTHNTVVYKPTTTSSDSITSYNTTYVYTFNLAAKKGNTVIFNIPYTATFSTTRSKYTPAADTKWYIDKNGDAVFHEIYADGGSIAGWWIDNEKIYQTTNGRRDGPIKTQLNSAGTASKDGFDYTIITDAINASMASIGGLLMSSGLINGYSIAQIANQAANAQATANAAQSAANTAQNAASAASKLADSVRVSLNLHIANGTAHNHTHYVSEAPGSTGGPQ